MSKQDNNTPDISMTAAVTIRKLTESDREALERLADLDSREPLEGAVLGAEVEGRLVAALSLADGSAIANPFARTVELRSLLELRAAQLRRRTPPRARSVIHRTRRRSRAALASSPPGSGGRLIELPRWG